MLGIVASVVLVTHLLPLSGLKGPLWGTHALAFFPLPVAWGATLLLAGALWFAFRFRPATSARTSAAAPWLLLSIPAAWAILWAFRARHTLLGDGIPMTIELARSSSRFHPREPLSFLLQRTMHDLAGPWLARRWPDPLQTAEATAGLVSVLAGGLFVPAAYGLARECVGAARGNVHRGVPLLVAGILLAQGYVQLFFGYAENYTVYALAVTVYLWLGLRYLNRRGPLFPPLAAGVIAFFLHLSGAVLLPSLLVLGIQAWRRDNRWGLLRDLAAAAGLGLGLAAWMSRVEPGYNVWGEFFRVGAWAVARQEERDPGYLFSMGHIRDFLNEQMLIGPLALFLFLPMAGWALIRRAGGMAALFLGLAGAAYAGVSLLAGDSNLGYARNWDLLAPGGIVYAAAGLHAVLAAAPSPRFYAVALAVSLYHTTPWILLNASCPRSLARVASLPLGGGRPEVLISTWFWNRGEVGEARTWSLKALETNPRSHTALRNLALIDMGTGDFRGAAQAFARAAGLRSDQPEYRRGYARAQLAQGETTGVREALESLLPVPADAGLWSALGDRQIAGEESTAAASSYARAVALDPRSAAATLKLGSALASMGRVSEALPWFSKATTLGNEPMAWFNLALAHAQLGQLEEARSALEEARSRTTDSLLSRRIEDLNRVVDAP